MSWRIVLLLPCLVSAYLPPPKKPVEQPTKTLSAGVSGSYGSIVGVQDGEVNYGLVNSNLPAPAMNYGSIKQQQPAGAPAPVEAPVSEGTGQVQAAYGSIKEASLASSSPPPMPKPSKVPAPPVPQSYDAYASAGEQQQLAVNPAQPPPPSSYGSINAAEAAYGGKVTEQTAAAAAAAATSAPKQPTQAPPVAGYGAPPVQPTYGAAAAQPQPQQPPPSGYAALPPTSAEQKPVESKVAAGSGTYETRDILKPKPAPVAPSGQYGGYMSLSMWKAKSKDDTVPKEEQQAEADIDASNNGADAEGSEEAQPDEDATPATLEEDQEAATQQVEHAEVDDQVDENKVVTAAPAPAPAPKACVDKNDYCDYWKTTGECEKNPAYMNANCPKACGVCKA